MPPEKTSLLEELRSGVSDSAAGREFNAAASATSITEGVSRQKMSGPTAGRSPTLHFLQEQGFSPLARWPWGPQSTTTARNKNQL